LWKDRRFPRSARRSRMACLSAPADSVGGRTDGGRTRKQTAHPLAREGRHHTPVPGCSTKGECCPRPYGRSATLPLAATGLKAVTTSGPLIPHVEDRCCSGRGGLSRYCSDSGAPLGTATARRPASTRAAVGRPGPCRLGPPWCVVRRSGASGSSPGDGVVALDTWPCRQAPGDPALSIPPEGSTAPARRRRSTMQRRLDESFGSAKRPICRAGDTACRLGRERNGLNPASPCRAGVSPWQATSAGQPATRPALASHAARPRCDRAEEVRSRLGHNQAMRRRLARASSW
jgi:hypothetical protein